MNFRFWNKVKKQLSFAKEKEKEVATLRPKRDDESKEERHLESKVQSYEDIQPPQSLSCPEAGQYDHVGTLFVNHV